MKAMILAGGLGTRFSEETVTRPKPLVHIGGYPILWHIMKIYWHYGIRDFIICAGYKGEMIREYFVNYGLQQSDITVDLGEGSLIIHRKRIEDWKITIVETGADTMTGGRVLAASEYLDYGKDFLLTYGDGVGDIDVTSLIEFHNKHGKEATVTAVTPPGRFGVLDIDGTGYVRGFREKIASDQYRVNAGFLVLKPNILTRIKGPETVLEADPILSLADDGHLVAYQHNGYWQPMDTLRDKLHLEKLWNDGCAPWAVWES